LAGEGPGDSGIYCSVTNLLEFSREVLQDFRAFSGSHNLNFEIISELTTELATSTSECNELPDKGRQGIEVVV